MLLNLSNHPYSQWSARQKELAEKRFGEVIDLPFPFVDPEMTTAEVKNLAVDYYSQAGKFLEKYKKPDKQQAVHIQGEFIFVYHLVTLLKNDGIKCVASTSKRDVQQVGSKKIINFHFIQFREY